jgi:hypothetical protein
MIGRAPMMAQPMYDQVPAEAYPPAQFMQPPAPFVNQPPPWVEGDLAPVQQAPPRPLVRAKGADDPPPAAPQRLVPLAMPSPEQLGISRPGSVASPATDWTTAHQRLNRLGALSFHLEKLSTTGYRFTCFLPTSQPGKTHRVEAVAPAEAEVMRLALDKAEEWAGQRK